MNEKTLERIRDIASLAQDAKWAYGHDTNNPEDLARAKSRLEEAMWTCEEVIELINKERAGLEPKT